MRVIPNDFLNIFPALSLLITGYLIERNFVGRIATFCNALAINLFIISLPNPNEYLVWYANLGVIMGLVGLVAYQSKTSLSKIYYTLSWAYSSVVVGLLMLLFSLGVIR